MSVFGSINIMDNFETHNILLQKTAFMPFLGIIRSRRLHTFIFRAYSYLFLYPIFSYIKTPDALKLQTESPLF